MYIFHLGLFIHPTHMHIFHLTVFKLPTLHLKKYTEGFPDSVGSSMVIITQTAVQWICTTPMTRPLSGKVYLTP